MLPYGRQQIDDDDIAAVARVLKGDFLTTGPAVDAFEQALADRLGVRHVVTCSSGTAALHLTAMAAELGPASGTAIVPSITFLATANGARYVGAEVRFADVAADTGLLLPDEIDRLAADGGARAVFPVHLAGQCADMAEIRRKSARHDLLVVEDASHAIGSRYQADGDWVAVGACRHSDMCVFSFHPVKTIAMGEGGAVTTNDDVLAAALRRGRSHGMTRNPGDFANTEMAFDAAGEANPWYYEMHEPGFNYRASDLHCALGLSQLGKLDGFVEKRRELVAAYDQSIGRLGERVRPLARMPGNLPAWHLYVVRIDFAALQRPRAGVMRALSAAGIGTQVHYVPVHRQPYYRKRYGDLDLPGADAYYESALSLPLHAGMTVGDVHMVIDRLVEALGV